MGMSAQVLLVSFGQSSAIATQNIVFNSQPLPAYTRDRSDLDRKSDHFQIILSEMRSPIPVTLLLLLLLMQIGQALWHDKSNDNC